MSHHLRQGVKPRNRFRGFTVAIVIIIIICMILLQYLRSDNRIEFSQPVIRGCISVKSNGLLEERVKLLNKELGKYRQRLLTNIQNTIWENIYGASGKQLKLINGRVQNYLQEICKHPEVSTLILPFLMKENISGIKSNLIIDKYYNGSYSKMVCLSMQSDCNRFMSSALVATAFDYVYLDINRVEKVHSPPPFTAFIQILRNALVDINGTVIIEDIRLMPHTCSTDIGRSFPQNYKNSPIYDELFVITQFWGSATFHQNVEVIPRLAAFLDFLRNNPNISILASHNSERQAEQLHYLGISSDRIVTGLSRAKLLYLPRASPCGLGYAPDIQLLSQMYRKIIRKFPKRYPRSTILLIRRSRTRSLNQHNEIEILLKEAAQQYNLTFDLFPDNPVPDLNQTMLLFNNAILVVAPHGAGLSNLVYSEPGTFIVEILCKTPMNLCYKALAYVLGMRYHGILAKMGCDDGMLVDISEIKNAVHNFLNIIKLLYHYSLQFLYLFQLLFCAWITSGVGY